MKGKPRLLLADDSRSMRNFYGRILEGEYEVSLFEDGAPLLEAARLNPPDVIVSDVNMPEMNGLDLVRVLKAHPILRPIPVIILTANESNGEAGSAGSVDCLDAGADDYLQKPFKAEELLARVRSAHRGFDLYKQLQEQHRELEAAYKRVAEMEVELRQAQKLEAVGRLAAGIAHEINTPIQFMVDNASFLRTAFQELAPLVVRYREAIAAASAGPLDAALLGDLTTAEEAADVEFTLAQAPSSIDKIIDGAERIATIVRAMNNFGREDGLARSYVDLSAMLQSTLEVARAEVQAVADVETDFGDLPLVDCQAGALSQVFLHLIINATHAIADAGAGRDGNGERGKIRIVTRNDGDGVTVAVSDTGTGIAEAVRHRIFDPFFTTKEVGRGSGQGLTVSRSIVERHGGTIRFDTDLGKGSTFVIALPKQMTPSKAATPDASGEENRHVTE